MKTNRFIAASLSAALMLSAAPQYNIIPFNTIQAYAVESSCGVDAEWSYDGKGTLTISGSGEMYDYKKSDAMPWYSLRNEISTVVVESGITHIGDYAFCGLRSIKKVTVGSGLLTVGRNAFAHCTALTDVEFPDGVKNLDSYTFVNCSALEKIDLPDSIEYIGDYSFSNCDDLRSVKLPDSLLSIESALFFDSGRLTEVIIPEKCKSIGMGAFEGTKLFTITLPESVESIASAAFRNCPELTKIEIKNSDCKIYDDASTICNKIGTAPIFDGAIFAPEGSTAETYAKKYGYYFNTEAPGPEYYTIEGEDFEYHRYSDHAEIYSWKRNDPVVVIPEEIDGLPITYCCDGSLMKCDPCEVTINTHMDIIGGANCFGATAINVPADNPALKSIDGVVFDKNGKTIIAYPKKRTDEKYVVPKGVETIKGAFNETDVKIVELPSTLRTITGNAFVNSQITEIVIPESTDVVEQGSFSNCSKLKKITFLNPECGIWGGCETINDLEVLDEQIEKSPFSGIICGYDNSLAQAYAEKCGYNFESLGQYNDILGDANADGNVNMADAVRIMQSIANPDEYRIIGKALENADVCDHDGLTNMDALEIQKYTLGIITEFYANTQ